MSAARYRSILAVWFFITTVAAEAPAPANDGLLLPVSIGVLLKVILVVFGVLVKLLFLGLTSLGGSGVALLLTLLFLKNNDWSGHPPPLWSGHPPHGWTDRTWPLVRMPHIHHHHPAGYHPRRYGKQMNQVPFLYKAETTSDYNGHHPVPVVDVMDPRSMPHQRMPIETHEYTTSHEKETPKLVQTYASAN